MSSELQHASLQAVTELTQGDSRKDLYVNSEKCMESRAFFFFFFYSRWSFQGLRFFTMPLAIITHSYLHKWPTQHTLHLANMQFSSSCDRLSLSPEPSFNHSKVKHYFKLQYTRVVLFVSSVKFQVLSVPYESKLLHVRNFPSILCLKHEIVYLYSCPFAKLFKRSYIKNKKLLQSVNLCLQNSVNIEMLELTFKKRSRKNSNNDASCTLLYYTVIQ